LVSRSTGLAMSDRRFGKQVGPTLCRHSTVLLIALVRTNVHVPHVLVVDYLVTSMHLLPTVGGTMVLLLTAYHRIPPPLTYLPSLSTPSFKLHITNSYHQLQSHITAFFKNSNKAQLLVLNHSIDSSS
jgi:hypothetical protein